MSSNSAYLRLKELNNTTSLVNGGFVVNTPTLTFDIIESSTYDGETLTMELITDGGTINGFCISVEAAEGVELSITNIKGLKQGYTVDGSEETLNEDSDGNIQDSTTGLGEEFCFYLINPITVDVTVTVYTDQ